MVSETGDTHQPLGYITRDGETVWDECETCYGQGWPCEIAAREEQEDGND